MRRAGILSSHLAGGQVLTVDAYDRHRKSGTLWKGSRDDVSKAIDLFLEEGEPYYPRVDVHAEVEKGVKVLHEQLKHANGVRPKKLWGCDNLFLTGATGFVGSHYLCQLLQDLPDCQVIWLGDSLADLLGRSQVYCLVRGNDQAHCEKRLRETAVGFRLHIAWDRVHVVRGDMVKPQLGIEQTEYGSLLSTIDTVLHFAARDNFFLPFEVLKRQHVDGLLNVIDFASREKVKALLHITTCKVRLLDELGGHIVENNGTLPLSCNS